MGQDINLVLKKKTQKFLCQLVMRCYWQQTDNTNTTKQIGIAQSSKKASLTRNTLEQLVASNTIKVSFQSSLQMKYSGTYTEILLDFLELPWQQWRTDRGFAKQTWRIYWGSGSCGLRNASKNHELITDSPTYTSEHITEAEDAMQFDLVLELLPSGGIPKLR